MLPKRVGVALVCLLLWLARVAYADVIYQYTGNPFTTVSSPYTTNNFISLTMDLPSAVPPSSSDFVLNSLTYTFSDGVQTLTQSNSMFGGLVSTDQNGAITSWDVAATAALDAQNTVSNAIATENDANGVQDGGAINLNIPQDSNMGANAGNPGTWTLVPEPSTLTLFAVGLSALGAVTRHRRGVGA